MTRPLLVFAMGNEARGDDALGPLLVRQLAQEARPSLDVLEDYQLQIEHVTDLAGREKIVFVDADVSCAPPYHFGPVSAAHDASYTSHAMSPAALLHAYREHYGEAAPAAFLLRIRGERFGLGDPLSADAEHHLQQALLFLRDWLDK